MLGISDRHRSAVDDAPLQCPAQHGSHHAAVLRPPEDVGVDAARDDDPPVHAERTFVRLIGTIEEIGELELTRVQPRADLCADVAADALADAAVIVRSARFRDLLRLAIDVVDDVVRTDEHARAAFTAAAVLHHLVHHRFEAGIG